MDFYKCDEWTHQQSGAVGNSVIEPLKGKVDS
jgi:hypothetical protein